MTLAVGAGEVVVLDIDDTLYLERSYVRSGFDAVGRLLAERHGLTDAAARLWAGFEAGARGNAFDQLLASYGMTPDRRRVDQLIGCYRSHTPGIELLADAERLLDRLDGAASAAITDGPALSQRAKAEALGLYRRLGLVVLTAELGPGRGKPHPAAYQLVETHFDVPGASCWYIADNPAKDFQAPLSRGWRAIRIRRDGALHRSTSTPEGVVEIATLDEIAT